MSKHLLFIVTVFLFSACAKYTYVIVPNTKKQFYDEYFLDYFDCISCPNKYEEHTEYGISIETNKITHHPFNTKHLTDSNLLYTIHNTFKSVGYKNLISEYFYSEYLSSFIDTILSHKNVRTDTSNYYYKFWQRRINQKNNVVFDKIVREIKSIYNSQEVPIEENYVSESFKTLLTWEIQVIQNKIEDEQMYFFELFKYLRQEEKYVEAYSLLDAPRDFTELGLDKIKLILTLMPDSTQTSIQNTDSTTLLGSFDRSGYWEDKYDRWHGHPGP